jgi:hypothetical protein
MDHFDLDLFLPEASPGAAADRSNRTALEELKRCREDYELFRARKRTFLYGLIGRAFEAAQKMRSDLSQWVEFGRDPYWARRTHKPSQWNGDRAVLYALEFMTCAEGDDLKLASKYAAAVKGIDPHSSAEAVAVILQKGRIGKLASQAAEARKEISGKPQGKCAEKRGAAPSKKKQRVKNRKKRKDRFPHVFRMTPRCRRMMKALRQEGLRRGDYLTVRARLDSPAANAPIRLVITRARKA